MSIGSNEAVERDEKNPQNWRTYKCAYCGEPVHVNIKQNSEETHYCAICKEKLFGSND